MLFFYGMKTLVCYLEKHDIPGLSFKQVSAILTGTESEAGEGRIKDWVNLGGQIVPAFRLDVLRQNIREGKITSWEEIHARYEAMAALYDKDRARHARTILAETGHPLAESEAFKAALEKAVQISDWVRKQVSISREKDFHDPFRSLTYRNKAEMEQVAGKVKDNPFIRMAEENHRRFAKQVEELLRS
jgi:alpha-amylase/alpha-mannosidase (GH57 family)